MSNLKIQLWYEQNKSILIIVATSLLLCVSFIAFSIQSSTSIKGIIQNEYYSPTRLGDTHGISVLLDNGKVANVTVDMTPAITIGTTVCISQSGSLIGLKSYAFIKYGPCT